MTNGEKQDLMRYLAELGDWLEIMDRGGGVLVASSITGANWDQVSHGQRDQVNAPVIVAASVERSLRAIVEQMHPYHREVLVEKHFWGSKQLRLMVALGDRKQTKMGRTTWWNHCVKAEADFMRARADVGDKALTPPPRVQVNVDINKPFSPPQDNAETRASAGDAA